MSTLLEQVSTGKQTMPRRVTIFGVHGVGKSKHFSKRRANRYASSSSPG